MKRREFLKLMTLVSSGTLVSSCSLDRGTEKLLPYLVPPEEDIIPGEAVYYRSTCTECPANCGLEVKVCDGYPVKLEGCPGHPLNDGALCIRGQASLSRLYHPDRIKEPLRKNPDGSYTAISWDEAFTIITTDLRKSFDLDHVNYYLSGRTTGTLSKLIDRFCKSQNFVKLPEFEHYNHAAIRMASKILYDKDEIPRYRIQDADVLFTIGADIIETFINPVENAAQLAHSKKYNNLFWQHAEPHVSLTGLQSDDRITINPGSEPYLLLFILNHCLQQGGYRNLPPQTIIESIPELPIDTIVRNTGLQPARLIQITQKLLSASNPLLIVGNISTGHVLGLETAIIAGLLQWILGMTNNPVDFSRSENYDRMGTYLDFDQFLTRAGSGKTGVMFISRIRSLASNPDEQDRLKAILQNTSLSVGLTDTMTEIMKSCDVILPLSHALESWGDSEPRKGIHTLIQPVLEPLYQTQSEGDILLNLMRFGSDMSNSITGKEQPFQEYLFQEWKKILDEEASEILLERGYFEEGDGGPKAFISPGPVIHFLKNMNLEKQMSRPVLVISPSIRSFDGRSKDLQLLQEIPDPVTTISYGAWVSVAEETAARLGIKDRDEVSISKSPWSITLPAKIQAGLPPDIYIIQSESLESINLEIDQQTGEKICYLENISVSRTSGRGNIPILSGSMSQKGRGIIPNPLHRKEEHQHHGDISLYPDHEHEEYLWAMVIDLALCTGCSACVAACYIENNVPLVGSREHLRGREMSWLRIEPYFDDNKNVVFIPMLCQHCEYAPCEPVCPVYATYHNNEGLNAQIYNRCVGTRYCSNNCPYKVRRFNWFTHKREIPMNKMLNPDISIRGKGVMEKCTFCIQRIRKARDTAKDASRKIRDGELTPACAQTCPVNAITFGNLLDKSSRVHTLAHSDRAYRVFEQLGTRPSVYYLRKT